MERPLTHELRDEERAIIQPLLPQTFRGVPLVDDVEVERTGLPARHFADFPWRALDSRGGLRRVAAKAERMPGRSERGANGRVDCLAVVCDAGAVSASVPARNAEDAPYVQ